MHAPVVGSKMIMEGFDDSQDEVVEVHEVCNKYRTAVVKRTPQYDGDDGMAEVLWEWLRPQEVANGPQT